LCADATLIKTRGKLDSAGRGTGYLHHELPVVTRSSVFENMAKGIMTRWNDRSSIDYNTFVCSTKTRAVIAVEE
jgi:hypothetical protein